MKKQYDQEFFRVIEQEEQRIIAEEEKDVWRRTLRYAGYSASCAVRDFSNAVDKAFPRE